MKYEGISVLCRKSKKKGIGYGNHNNPMVVCKSCNEDNLEVSIRMHYYQRAKVELMEIFLGTREKNDRPHAELYKKYTRKIRDKYHWTV